MNKILHSITCTRFVPAYNAYEEFQRSIIRPRPLTLTGVQRMFRRGCDEYPACPDIQVIHVQKAHYMPR